MKHAYIIDGVVSTVIDDATYSEDIYGPNPADVEGEEPGEPVVVHRQGDVVPFADCYHPDFVAQCADVPDSVDCEQGYTYDGTHFAPPAPYVAPPMTSDQAKAARDALLGVATLNVAPLQDAVDLDEATDAETALLKLWKQYRVALSRIEQQAGFPAAVVWPVAPS